MREELLKLLKKPIGTFSYADGKDYLTSEYMRILQLEIEELFIKIVRESKPDNIDLINEGIHLSNGIDIYEDKLLEAIKSE